LSVFTVKVQKSGVGCGLTVAIEMTHGDRVAAGACYLKAWLIRSDAAGRWLIPALKKEDLANFIRGEGDEQGWQLFVVNNIGGNPFCDIQWRGTMLAG
jgi:hypothetical protein